MPVEKSHRVYRSKRKTEVILSCALFRRITNFSCVIFRLERKKCAQRICQEFTIHQRNTIYPEKVDARFNALWTYTVVVRCLSNRRMSNGSVKWRPVYRVIDYSFTLALAIYAFVYTSFARSLRANIYLYIFHDGKRSVDPSAVIILHAPRRKGTPEEEGSGGKRFSILLSHQQEEYRLIFLAASNISCVGRNWLMVIIVYRL